MCWYWLSVLTCVLYSSLFVGKVFYVWHARCEQNPRQNKTTISDHNLNYVMENTWMLSFSAHVLSSHISLNVWTIRTQISGVSCDHDELAINVNKKKETKKKCMFYTSFLNSWCTGHTLSHILAGPVLFFRGREQEHVKYIYFNLHARFICFCGTITRDKQTNTQSR